MPMYRQSYATQPFSGRLPSMKEVGPSDLRYSSSTAPHFQRLLDKSHGRQLAGVGSVEKSVEVMDEETKPAWAANELAVYAEMDDVQANGIFDPPGSRPNIYPDAGVLAPRFAVPGYLARERMYAESEVVDVTTGRPVVYVNGGAVSMDSAAQIAFLERGMYDPPDPVVGAARAGAMPQQSITNVRVVPQEIWTKAAPAVRGLGQSEGMGTWGTLALLGIVGLAAGGAYAAFKAGKKR